MASCLGCGSRFAKIIYSRTVSVVVDGVVIRRETWRISHCPQCGKRRRQTITDDGETIKGKIHDPGDIERRA